MNNNIKWSEILGDPQQNESVCGNDIIREVDLHKFKILWSFPSNEEAKNAFKSWLDQYDFNVFDPENAD